MTLADTAADTSSAAIAIFAVVIGVGLLSIVAVSSRGRRTLLPVTAILLGAAVLASTISVAWVNRSISPVFFIGLFIAALLMSGGLGALREGTALPHVEGVEPTIGPRPPLVDPRTGGMQEPAQNGKGTAPNSPPAP